MNNDLRQGRIGANLLALLLDLFISLELSETILERDGNGNDRVTSRMLLAPLGHLGQVLVLLADVILLGQVHEVDDRLGRKQEQGVDDLDLVILLAPCSYSRNAR